MWFVYLVVVGAVFVTSWASILIRWCGSTSALVISFYRLFWAGLLFAIISIPGNRESLALRGPLRKQWFLIPLAGVMLALHFASWISSLKFTTIAQSLVLESTHPVFALLLAPFFLKESFSWRAFGAVMLTLFGVLFIGELDWQLSPRYFVGDVLALSSAVFVTFYLFIARFLRHKIGLQIYLTVVYLTAAATLFPFILVTHQPVFRYSLSVHGYMFLLALGPTGIGHSLINWAARRIPVYRINLLMLGELLIASLLAYVLFHEQPGASFGWGAPFIVSGIILAITEPYSGITR